MVFFRQWPFATLETGEKEILITFINFRNKAHDILLLVIRMLCLEFINRKVPFENVLIHGLV